MPKSKYPLKVGFVLDDSLDPPDGVQQYVLTVSAWLRENGHEVHYLVSASSRQDLPNIHVLGKNMAVRFNGNSLHMPLPADRRQIRDLLAREHFDVLHVQMLYSPLLAGRIITSAERRTAVVGTFHNVPLSRWVSLVSRLLALWCAGTLRRFDSVVSVSRAAQVFAREAFGITSTVVPNTIRLDDFRLAKPLPRPGFDAKTLHILFLGRLVPRKGCLLLLQAALLLKNQSDTPPFHVTICGKGPLLDSLQQFVQQNGLEKHVTFAGFIPEADKPRWYASADLTVFPSSGGESFGIVLLEAMASGRSAVLAGDNAGYRCVLESCPSDVLFDPRDAPALAAKLSELLRDPATRNHIAAWQRHHAEQFDVARVGVQVLEVYTKALQRRR